jgi:hypothetical protein
LTITSRPLLSSAGWTCAIDAVASGSGSMLAKTSAGSSSAIRRRICSNGTGGTWSTSFSSSSM